MLLLRIKISGLKFENTTQKKNSWVLKYECSLVWWEWIRKNTFNPLPAKTISREFFIYYWFRFWFWFLRACRYGNTTISPYKSLCSSIHLPVHNQKANLMPLFHLQENYDQKQKFYVRRYEGGGRYQQKD